MAAKPPLGWNSFNSYGVYLHDAAAMANARAMAAWLRPHGYEYFVIDNGWFGEYALRPGTRYAAEKHAGDVRLNEHGYFLPSRTCFPDGFEHIVRFCREHGLKFGLHLMRGIPRKACELNLPIEGTPYTARDIANFDPKENCTWCHYCHGVDMTKPGAQAWYDGLIRHVADLGVEMIKYDDIVEHPDEVEALAKAIAKTGKPILLSLSPGGAVDPAAIEFFRLGNMLRVTHDVWDEQKDIEACFAAWEKWRGHEHPGFWIDMDMLPFGQLQLMSPPGGEIGTEASTSATIALAGKGTHRWSKLTRAQMRTFITLRALAASPLMMGGDLPTLDPYSLRLITDPDMLACNQNGVMGNRIRRDGGIDIWRTPDRADAAKGWLGVFNRTAAPADFVITAAVLGLSAASRLHDVWGARPLACGETVTLEAHDALFLRIT